MSTLYGHAKQYLKVRRTLGFKLRGHDLLLESFIDYVNVKGGGSVTAESALLWATLPANVQPIRWAQRLSAVRGFARYLHGMDPTVEVPSSDLLPVRRQRSRPYLYSHTDINQLIQKSTTLKPELRAKTYGSLYSLLAITGMRIGEAIALNRDNVNLEQGSIHIVDAKFRKQRHIPLHPSAMQALHRYATRRDALCPNPKTPSFFVSMRGTRLQGTCVRCVFRRHIDSIDLENKLGSNPPRIHDLRHSFAVATLCDWYRSGIDVNGQLPILSTFLGHSSPASTYWYLQNCPDLLRLAASRVESTWSYAS